MLQCMYNAYLRGYKNKSIGVYGSGLNKKEYKKGLSDFKLGLPNRYLKINNKISKNLLGGESPTRIED